VLAFGLACAGGGDSAVDAEVTPPEPAMPSPVTVEGEEGQDVVVVPVPEEGAEGTHWCCEYSDGGATKYALADSKTTCDATYGSKSGRWVDGAQCIPCCCKSPNDEGNLDLGYTFALTTPSACAGSGECVPMGDDTCEVDDKDEPKPAPRPTSGSAHGSRRPSTPDPAPEAGAKRP
jgi:hypothetical protein